MDLSPSYLAPAFECMRNSIITRHSEMEIELFSLERTVFCVLALIRSSTTGVCTGTFPFSNPIASVTLPTTQYRSFSRLEALISRQWI